MATWINRGNVGGEAFDVETFVFLDEVHPRVTRPRFVNFVPIRCWSTRTMQWCVSSMTIPADPASGIEMKIERSFNVGIREPTHFAH